MSRHRFLLCTMFLVLLLVGCTGTEKAPRVDPAKTEQGGPGRKPVPAAGLRIAVGGMITPKEGFAYYRDFLDYISRQLGEPVQYVDAENYDAINNKLKRGEIDAAFVCSGPYVDGKKEFNLELLAAPRAYGGTVYYAYIIVPKKSTAQALDDLRGKKFAFTDPLSNTGRLVPEYMLQQKGARPEAFFGSVVYSGSHDKSISAVNQGLVDGASVDSLIWEYASRTRPEQTANTRIILKSAPYAIPPFVVRPGLDPGLKQRLMQVLLTAHTLPEGKVILEKMMIERFEAIDDGAYDSIRAMKRLTGN